MARELSEAGADIAALAKKAPSPAISAKMIAAAAAAEVAAAAYQDAAKDAYLVEVRDASYTSTMTALRDAWTEYRDAPGNGSAKYYPPSWV